MVTVSGDAVRARAYQLWEEGGCIDGRHEEHWRRAEAECAAAGDVSGEADRVEGAASLAGLDEGRAEGASAAASGLDGEISGPLIDLKRKPRRWPTPIIDA